VSTIPEVRYARRGDDHIAYQVLGDGPLDIVEISIWFSHVDGRWEIPEFAHYLRRLASFARLIVFDRRGSGASDPPSEGTLTWEAWADDVRAVMDAAGSDQAALLAVADGGPLAITFAATYPERTSALVLANTSARFTKIDGYELGFLPEAVDDFVSTIERSWGTGDFLELLAPQAADDEKLRASLGRYQRLSSGPRIAAAMARIAAGMDTRHALPTVGVPTLVLHRAGLEFVGAEHGRYLAEHIPGARYVELQGSEGPVFLGDTDRLLDEVEEFLTGVRRGADPDRVLATVLFTDIVDSTARASALGDRRWREVLDEHDRIAAGRVEEHRGRLVKSTGDGLLATFDGPARAVSCARALRDALRALDLEVRAGLHTGEIEVRGDDIGGIGVHIAARVAAEAHRGEVMVSRTVTDLVVGSGIEFADRGTHRLKGVPGDWQLFAVDE
jgi:class 3 adenylate cyclase